MIILSVCVCAVNSHLILYVLFLFIYLQKQKSNSESSRRCDILWWMNCTVMIEIIYINIWVYKVKAHTVDTYKNNSKISKGARHLKSIDRTGNKIYCKFIRKAFRNWYAFLFMYHWSDFIDLVFLSLSLTHTHVSVSLYHDLSDYFFWNVFVVLRSVLW